MIQRHGRTAGITLFELIVVICVAALLAVLMVYSMSSLSIRTRISRVKEEHRQLASSISRYQLDHNHIPNTSQGLEILRRRSELPKDPFRKGEAQNYAYITLGDTSHGYLLISAGPDGKFNIPATLLPFAWGAEPLTSNSPPSGTSGRPASQELTDAEIEAFYAYLRDTQYDPLDEDASGRDIITHIRY